MGLLRRVMVERRSVLADWWTDGADAYASAAALRAMASSGEATPPCLADHVTGFSRKRRTSDSD